MKLYTFALRTTKEILRDPLYVAFGLGFPLVILVLLTAIQSNIPIDLFDIEKLTPGISVFGLSFMTLFASVLVAKDRSSSLLCRLYTTPLKARDYILGYTLPLLPMGFIQTVICYSVAILLGLDMHIHVLYAILLSIPTSLFFISLGLLLGTIFNDKQASGICGPLFTNMAGWLSGVWFDLSLVGGWFKDIAYALPFVHALELQKSALRNITISSSDILSVSIYALVSIGLSIYLFTYKMQKDQ